MSNQGYRPTTNMPIKTSLIFNGKNVFEMQYKEGTFTRQKIREHSQWVSNNLSRNTESTLFSVSLHYEDIGIHGKGYTKPGNPVLLWNPSDSDIPDDVDDTLIGFSVFFTLT